MAKQFTLGKNERLKSRKSIEQLFNEGKGFVVNPIRVYCTIEPFTSDHLPYQLQFGTGVGTKNFKKAVERNRIKRLIREAYRLQKLPLQKKLDERKLNMNLFFIYTGKEIPEYKNVYDKVNLILDKLNKIVDEIK